MLNCLDSDKLSVRNLIEFLEEESKKMWSVCLKSSVCFVKTPNPVKKIKTINKYWIRQLQMESIT